MDTSELKLRIFRQIDSLEKNRLQELYGFLQNFIRGDKEIDDWRKLSDEQKTGILNAIDEIDSGAGILHEDVIRKYRKKYSDD